MSNSDMLLHGSIEPVRILVKKETKSSFSTANLFLALSPELFLFLFSYLLIDNCSPGWFVTMSKSW